MTDSPTRSCDDASMRPPTVGGPPQPEFNPELDGVRGMAMAAVFLFHCAPKTGIVAIDAFHGSLWPAIDVFFALSGFLITRNLLDDRDNVHRFRNFYINRILRIVPAYLLVLFVIFALLPLNATMARAVDDVPHIGWFLSYTFNFKIAFDNGWPDNHLMNHFWSLCVEEQFYLLWPLFVYLLHERWRVHLVVGIFAVALAAELWFLWQDAHWAVTHSQLLTRLDSVTIGAAMAFLHRSAYRASVLPWMGRAFYLSSAVLVFCAVAKSGLRFTGWHAHAIVQPMLMVWSASLVYLLVNARPQFPRLNWTFRRPAFLFLGKYSYGIYLFHWIVYMSFVELGAFGPGTGSAWGDFGVVAVLTIILALLSYHGLEKRCLRLKARSYVPRAPTGAGSATAAERGGA